MHSAEPGSQIQSLCGVPSLVLVNKCQVRRCPSLILSWTEPVQFGLLQLGLGPAAFGAERMEGVHRRLQSVICLPFSLNSNLCCQSLPLDLLLKRREAPDPPKDPLILNTWLQLVTHSEPGSLPSMEQQSSAAATQPHKFCSCFSDTSSPSHSDITKLIQTGWPRQEEFKLLGRKPILILMKNLSVTKMPFFIY